MEQGGVVVQNGVGVKPNPAIPEEKKKVNVLAVVFGIIALVSVGLAVFFGIEFFKPKDGSMTTQVNESEEVVEEDVVVSVSDMAEEYKDTKDTMEAVASSIENSWSNTATTGNGGLTYKPEGLNTYVPIRFSLEIKVKNTDNADTNVGVLRSKLEAAGFSSLGVLPFLGSAGPQIYGYLNSDKNIVCGVYVSNEGENYYASLECAKASWIWLTVEERKMAGELEDAYHNKTGDYTRVLAFTGKVKDSMNKPYQTIQVSIGGAVGLFYRANANSEWKFFTATQGPLKCSDYSTDELKKAFAGDVCYDGDKESKV